MSATETGPSSDASIAASDAVTTRLRRVTGHDDPIEWAGPLTPLQEAMLFHAVAADADDVYVVQQRLDVTGTLDLEAFRAAWNHVIGRHPALRSLFVWDGSAPPTQIVCRTLEVPVEAHDLRTVADPDEQIADYFEADRRRRFQLDRPPLMRLAVFQITDSNHVVMWSQHHLLEDGWSASVVLDEVFSAYEAYSRGTAPALPAPRPFSDYVEWTRLRDLAEDAAFWKDHLNGLRGPTQMVSLSHSFGGSNFQRRIVTLPPDDLQAAARDHGLTLNTLLLGSLAIAAGRYTNSDDIAIGVVASGRPPELSGVETMVGMFINTVVLRLPIDGDMPAVDWLLDVQSRQTAVLEHQYSGLPDLQAWSGLGAATTLTDILFALWGFGGSGVSPSGSLEYKTVEGYGRTSFPFSLTVEAGDSVQVMLDFEANDFDPARAEAFLTHYARIVASIAASPMTAVAELTMLSDAELGALAAYNTTAIDAPSGSVVDAFQRCVAQSPDAPAVRDRDHTMTYRELDDWSDAVAAEIIQRTSFSARRVAILLPRSASMVGAMLAALKAGAAYVPIDRHLPRERIAYLLSDSDADVVLTNDEMVAELPDGAPTAITLPLSHPPDRLDFDIPAATDDIAYVMYTSGSTGRPKGVMVTHGNLGNYVAWAAATYAAAEPVTFPLYTSPGFDLTVTSVFVPLVTGGSVLVYPDDDRRDLSILDVFTDDAVDVVKLTPSHLAMVELDGLATDRIQTLIVGGEDLRTDIARSVSESVGGRLRIFNEYGPTEATVGCMVHRFDPEVDTGVSVPIGVPAGNAQIHLLDPSGSPTPPGAIGEIYIGGAGVARGYLGNPEMTAERFVPDPTRPGHTMYRSGDLATFERPGVLSYVGRADDQVKIRGNRIELGEIDTVLSEHAGIAAAATAIRQPNPGDVRLVSYYVPDEGGAANLTSVRNHLQHRLPEYMVPQHLVPVTSLPITPNGKLDRDALPQTLGATERSTAFVAPRNREETLVARLAANLIGVDRVSITDNFFDLGGHSILSMQLIAQLHRETGVRISPRVVLLNRLSDAASLLAAELTGIATSDRPSDLAGLDGVSSKDPTTEHAATRDIDPPGTSVVSSAFYFGSAEHSLFGIHSAPSGAVDRLPVVVLCPPIGWEYMRTHWTMRKIARLLNNAGHHTLRFDYRGTGDSAGDRRSPTIEHWLEDIDAAIEEARHLADTDDIVLVGVRLGGTLAAIACERGMRVSQLVLWDPIVTGRDYLAELDRMHHEMIAQRGKDRSTADMQGDELLGFPYPLHRRADITEIDLRRTEWPDIPCVVVASAPRGEYQSLLERRGRNLRLDLVPDATKWDELASSLGALLPTEIPQHIAATVAESREKAHD